LTVKPFVDEGVRSILVYVAAQRLARFRVILNSHLDIIPGKDFQYISRIDGDRRYGVSDRDMKLNFLLQ
jgi:hypothetical protein